MPAHHAQRTLWWGRLVVDVNDTRSGFQHLGQDRERAVTHGAKGGRADDDLGHAIQGRQPPRIFLRRGEEAARCRIGKSLVVDDEAIARASAGAVGRQPERPAGLGDHRHNVDPELHRHRFRPRDSRAGNYVGDVLRTSAD